MTRVAHIHCRMVAIMAPLLMTTPTQATAAQSDWPQLDGDKSNAYCEQALKIAEAKFNSEGFYLYGLPTIPNNSGSRLVLQYDSKYGMDISGGKVLIADSQVFKEIPKGNKISPRSIYWEIAPRHALRLVMDEEAFGWRGDQYALYTVKKDISPEQFLEGMQRKDKLNETFEPAIEQNWRPPLILREKKSGELWAIDVGAPFIFLSDWNVYSHGSDGFKQTCSIHFRPKVQAATELLPLPIQKLAKLLDGTLGSGEDEGTLQPTAHLRVEMEHTWANIALRPWVLADEPYNSREKVDAGLKNWASQGPSYGKLYRDIASQYPKAEQALALYYRQKFNKEENEADKMAKHVLDYAYRSYFAFSD